jgi:hypothetical protein
MEYIRIFLLGNFLKRKYLLLFRQTKKIINKKMRVQFPSTPTNNTLLKGHFHENDFEIITLYDRLGPN